MRPPSVDCARGASSDSPADGLKKAKSNALILATVMSLTVVGLYIADGRIPLIPILSLVAAFFAAAYPCALVVFHLSRAVKDRNSAGATRT